MRQFAPKNELVSRKGYATIRFAVWSCVALLVVALMTPFAAKAQLAGTGEIAGSVTDASGAVIGGATVTATMVSQNTSTVRTTTGAGDYSITPLTPGVYSVTVTAKGFQTFVQQNVTVNALQTVALNIKLTIGAAQQTITVTAAPPILETSDATLGAVMDNEMYSSLPLQMGYGGNADQRRSTDFEYLMPGVQGNYTSNNSTDNSGIVNGSGPAGGVSEIYLEGVNLPEADQVGDPRFTWTAFGVDAIDQFQVQTSGYSAQYAGQGVENYSVKQGTNEIHGAIYEYLRNTVLDSWGFFNKVPQVVANPPAGGTCAFNSTPSSWCKPGGVKSKEIMNEVGLNIGGPIIKNKLFLFYNYGQYRNQNGPAPAAQTEPTLAMMGYSSSDSSLGYADFTGYSTATGYNIYDPANNSNYFPTNPGSNNCAGTAASPCSRNQFAYNGTLNQIPGSRISPAAAKINALMLPYEALVNQATYANNLVIGYENGLSNWYTSGRIDYDMNQKNQLSAIIAFGRQASTGPNSSGASNQLGPPFNNKQSYAPQTTVDILKDTITVTPHMVDQVAVAYGRYRSLSVTPDLASNFSASTLGLLLTPAGQATLSFPGVSFSGEDSPTNEAGYSENLKVNNTYTAMDNLEWQLGKNSLAFGGQVIEVQFNYVKNLTYSSPLTYTFNQTETEDFTNNTTGVGTGLNASSGSPFASYMLGAVDSSSVTIGVPGLGSRWLNPSFWGQDDFKVTPKLTLNLGLRWDIWPSIHEAHNLSTWLNPTGQNSVTGNLGTLAFAGGSSSDGYHTGVAVPSPIYYKSLAPRVGAAYALNNKTVIRASYDVAFARGDWTSGSQNGSPSQTGLTPSATAAAGLSGSPQFYWDNGACSNGNANAVACGWTGSISAPAPPAGGTSLAEFATTETVVLKNAGGSTMTYFDPHDGARSPEFINWSFGLQRQLTNNMSVSISYVGSEGHFISASKAIGSRNNELPESLAAMAGYNVSGSTATPCSGAACSAPLLAQKSTTTDLGLATSNGFTVPNPYNSADSTYYASNSVYQYYYPFPQFSGVSDTTSFVGNENWNALEISLRQRPAHGLNLMVNYTYSKSIDDLGTFRVGDNDRLDRSISTTDEPQNLTATAVYQLPIGKGHMWGDNWAYSAIASDWSLSGIGTYHSGYPIAVTGKGCGGNGILNQCMPEIIAGQPGRQNGAYGKNVTAASGSPNYIGNVQYINPGAFTVLSAGTSSNYGTSVNTTSTQATYVGNGPALYAPGNAPRVGALNMFGMGYYDVDLALKRTFPIHENWKFAFEGDLTNFTNHVVFSSPNAVVNNGASFGTISGTSSAPRELQVMGRIIW